MRRIVLAVLLAVGVVYVLIEYDWRAAITERAAQSTLDEMVPTWQLARVEIPDQRRLFDEAARRAWAYADTFASPTTGFVRPVPDYDAGTLWDIASGLAALHCAYLLGLTDIATYDDRMRQSLNSLERIPLFDGTAFNKTYLVGTGTLAGRDGLESATGYGWSAVDIGRLLVWLRIIATHSPAYAETADRIVRRMRLERIADGDALRGGERREAGGSHTFQEGRIGYEQYAASGFSLWGRTVQRALDWTAHTEPRTVFGQRVLGDRRPHGCLTGEPFFLTGLELGWDPDGYRLALGVLAAQRARFEETDTLTIVSEDASHAEPYFFYYYCIDLDGESFAVTAQGTGLLEDGPRALSTKAAFAWYALSPNAYTKTVLEAVAAFLDYTDGLPAGIVEAALVSAGPDNINTAAVVLESAVFARTQTPLLELDATALAELRFRP